MTRADYEAESQLLRAIAHPVRLRILEHLIGGEKCVTQMEQLAEGIPQPTISQHLAVLRHLGIVGFRREGNKRCYFLTRPEMVAGVLSALRGQQVTVEEPVL